MENKLTLLINIALEQGEESGVVSAMVVEISEDNANLILREQEDCSLVAEGGALATLINSYGILNGYLGAYFIRAFKMEEEQEEKSDVR